MAKSIIGGVTEEIKELGKDVAKESAKQPLEIGKDFFRQMIGMEGVTAPSKEEQEKNIAQKKQEEEKKTARIRKFLHEEQVKPALAKEES
ncbi:hypothetical protein HYS11_00810 [Candidatus Gottesmanbacteria bacterium]|nr:hypothetical protein [Candidatus Gottesmanbacteria bacterium]